ncbi:DUF2892 domain-containing protein [Thermodesulfobacteriota bacterium]
MAIILGIFAVIFVLTSAISFCPLYLPFKILTKPSLLRLKKQPLYIDFHAPDLFQALTINESKSFGSRHGVLELIRSLVWQPGLS